MRRPLLLLLLAVLAVVALVAGIGVVRGSGGDGAGSPPNAADASEAAAAGTDELLDEPPSPDLVAGWRTDFTRHSVPFSEIQSGGPSKDGIPAIDAPRFVPVAGVDFLGDKEPVIEVDIDGEVRGYPLQILIWHEIVNDTIGGVPVSVTFCPLCNTAIVFDRRLDGQVLDFGTTGNLRNSDLVMYDRQTESWWQQFSGEGIVGELTGKELTQLPARIVSWSAFEAAHPDGEVLSRETGYRRSYGANPYVGYDDVDSAPFFPAANRDDERLPPKERVVLLEENDETVVVPFSVLAERKKLEVEVGGRRLTVTWAPGVTSALDSGGIASSRDIGSAEVRENGVLVPFDQPFWFAVAAFRPDARIVR
jgi:hypothetical protein